MNVKEKLPGLIVAGVILFPLLIMIVVAFLMKVSFLATMFFISVYLIPVLVFMFLARDDFMLRLKMRFLRQAGYIILEIVSDDFRKVRVPVKPEGDRLVVGKKTWRYVPDFVVFSPGNIPTYVVNERDVLPIDLMGRQERTLYLDKKDLQDLPEESIAVGVDAKGAAITENKVALKVADSRIPFRPEEFYTNLIEAAQKARIDAPQEMKILLYAAGAAALFALIAMVISFQTQTNIQDLTRLVQALS